MSTLNISASHDITPVASSARRVRDGGLADLRDPRDYPAEAVCLVCGQPIRIEWIYLSEWRHIERFSDPGCEETP